MLRRSGAELCLVNDCGACAMGDCAWLVAASVVAMLMQNVVPVEQINNSLAAPVPVSPSVCHPIGII